MLATLLALSVLLVILPGCGTTTNAGTNGGKIQVVAAENFWGSIATQVGGEHVQVTSIIVNPDTDPHDYEATPADARTIAGANYVIFNGVGYDPWVRQLLDANPVSGRKELEIGKFLSKQEGDNPHFWYNPDYVTQVANQITADLKRLDSADASYFDQQNQQFLTTGLKGYHDLISTIKQKYQGTPVGATESIFAYLAPALGLDLITPPDFMKAISEGTEPTAEDKATFDQQVTQKLIKVFVYNKQNATPDTDALKVKAQQAGIPIVAITETLDPGTASFQEWQSAQLQALEQALAQATGK
jgi:zinc/manganese transport system substrate-binding protein